MMELCVDLVERLKKLGADVAIATGEASGQRQVKFANSKIVRSSVEESNEVHLFAAVGERTGETVINAKEGNLEAALARFVELVKKLPENEEFEGVASGKFTYPALNSFDQRTANASEELVEIVRASLDAASRTRAGGMLEVNSTRTFLYSSEGPSCTSTATSAYFSIRCLAEQTASGHKVACHTHLAGFDPIALSSQAAELASKARNPIKGEEGVYNIVFDAFPFAALLDPFASSTSIFSVESGVSALRGKLGKKIASEHFSLYDDPTAPGAFHSTPFDDEGTPTTRVPIVEAGMLKTYLHSTSTAKRHGAASTGHAGVLAPHPRNPSVKPGNATLDELLSEAGNGIYITNVWYTRFQNYATGDFSTIPRDAIFQIKNGELAKPIRGIRVSDNLLNLLSNIALLSKHQHQIYGWEVELPIFSCDALVGKVKVTCPQNQ